ncbi:hypothetical protein [Nocardiopsis protaetiae]|uniref:hypothetical protein n=1 Tax=Nocardiopsis protaetiae TaxID=3382270 RepID=UPI00387B6ED2
MTNTRQHTRDTGGETPVDTAMRAAADAVTDAFAAPVPFGGEADALDQAVRVWQHADTIRMSVLMRLVQMEPDGELSEITGYRTLQQ